MIDFINKIRWHTHLEVKEEADIAKKVAFDWLATALAIIVLPFPGGPNKSKPNSY